MVKKRMIYMNLKKFICFALTACMVTAWTPAVAFAEDSKGTLQDFAVTHVLNEENNWDISKEIIMPGDSFVIEPKYEFSHEKVQNVDFWAACPRLIHASLYLDYVGSNDYNGENVRWYTDKLVRSKAEPSKIVPCKNNTYNVIKMAYDRGDLDSVLASMKSDDEENKKALEDALKGEVTVNAGYVNNTDTPIVLEQVRGGSSQSEGAIYGGEYGMTVLVDAFSTQNWGCTIQFYEPYYTITYENLLDGEEKGLPDRYYIKPEKQEIILPNPVRAGYHFVEWRGGLNFADKINDGENTVYTFDWENNLAEAGYDFGDETLEPHFSSGYTVTFNANGGLMDDEEYDICELDMKSDEFLDISKHIPKRDGYDFVGWCLYPDAGDDSLIKNTDNYDWVDKWDTAWHNDMYPDNDYYDIQLYAKWKKADPCADGHKVRKSITKATTKTNGKIVAKCSVCNKTISKKVIAKASDISLSDVAYIYNGKVRKPSVTVNDSNGKKIGMTNYTISYDRGRKNVGSYDVTINLKGNYKGKVKKTFTINPESTVISKLTEGKKKLIVKWKKQSVQTTGYQIQYSTSGKFAGAKTVTVSDNPTTEKTITELKSGKKYYVRIRTYKSVNVNGKTKKLCSSWSKIKSVKVKG